MPEEMDRNCGRFGAQRQESSTEMAQQISAEYMAMVVTVMTEQISGSVSAERPRHTFQRDHHHQTVLSLQPTLRNFEAENVPEYQLSAQQIPNQQACYHLLCTVLKHCWDKTEVERKWQIWQTVETCWLLLLLTPCSQSYMFGHSVTVHGWLQRIDPKGHIPTCQDK